MWPLRPRVTLAVVLPQGPAAVPLSSVADPQFALTCRDARFSSISTESLSYGVLPPVDPLGVGSALPEAAPLPALSLEGDDGSSDAWVDGVELGTQSDPLSTVPSGQLPGESAPLAPPSYYATEARPTALWGPT